MLAREAKKLHSVVTWLVVNPKSCCNVMMAFIGRGG